MHHRSMSPQVRMFYLSQSAPQVCTANTNICSTTPPCFLPRGLLQQSPLSNLKSQYAGRREIYVVDGGEVTVIASKFTVSYFFAEFNSARRRPTHGTS
jgi:hypothetical protein